MGSLEPDEFADRLDNLQRTSTRSGILKAEAVQLYARVLTQHRIVTLSGVADLHRTITVERDLAAVRGQGFAVRVAYLWMLAGDDQHVKPDRMVRRWTSNVVGRQVGVAESTRLVTEAAAALAVTPWVLDHAIWTRQRAR